MASGKGKGKGKRRPPPRRPAGATGKTPGTAARAAGAAGAPAPAPTTDGQAPREAAGRGKPTRAERIEAARRARKRKALLTRVGIAGGLALIVLVVAVVVIDNRREANANIERLTAGSCNYDTRTDPLINNHVPPASYEVDPPSGGDHDPSPAPAGFYEAGQTVPGDANLVHSLEHGFAVIWHRPDASEEDLAALRGVFDEYSEDVIVVPRASLDAKVAVTAWERRLLCTEIEPDTLGEFVELYRNDSPEPNVR